MNKKILIGSTLAAIILLASFSSIASAQTTNVKDSHSSLIQLLKEKQKSSLSLGWLPGDLIGILINIIFLLFAYIFIGHPL